MGKENKFTRMQERGIRIRIFGMLSKFRLALKFTRCFSDQKVILQQSESSSYDFWNLKISNSY